MKNPIHALLDAADRAAYVWQQYRTNRAVEAMKKEPGYKDMELINTRFDASGWSVDLNVNSELVYLAQIMAEMLEKNKAENYLQLVMFPRLATGVRPVEVTLRWYFGGLTPAEKNARLEAQIEEQKRKISALRDLLGEALGGAAFASCLYAEDEIADACWHCCDWSDWVKKVCAVLGIALPSPEDKDGCEDGE